MKARFCRRAARSLAWAALLAVGCGAGRAAFASAPAAPDPLAPGWTADSDYFPREAYQFFSDQLRAAPGSRPARLGAALSLLTYPPTTDERIARARVALEQLAAGDDEPALAARYFLGRIAQVYQRKPDYAAAAARFRELAESHAADYWGQLALTKLGILTLYALPAAGPEQRVAQAEALLARADPPAACDLHLIIADACLYYQLPEARALRHLLAADAIGVPSDLTRADVWVQIVEISIDLGDRARATAYGKKFLDHVPRDTRRYAIEQQLASIAAGGSGHGPWLDTGR